MNRLLKEDYINEAIKPIIEIVEEINSQTVDTICRTLAKIGEIRPTEINSITNHLRYGTVDIAKLQSEIARLSGKAEVEIEHIFKQLAKENDTFGHALSNAYTPFAVNKTAQTITQQFIKNAQDDLLNLVKTAAFVVDGQATGIRNTYIRAVDKAIATVRMGASYNQGIQSTVKQLAQSGLRTVDFESGYSRRLDSQVRMNTIDGVRKMNQEIRKQQAKEYGAEMVQITSHGLPAPDHQHIDGQLYTIEDWAAIEAGLKRKVGMMNCKHDKVYRPKGSTNIYSEKELSENRAKANKKLEYTTADGKTHSTTGYYATQVQRRYEVKLRDLDEQIKAFNSAQNPLQAQLLRQSRTQLMKEYKSVSAQLGLSPKMDRVKSLLNGGGSGIIKKNGTITKVTMGHSPNPIKSKPNSICDHIGGVSGRVETRSYYNAMGQKALDVTNHNHGNEAMHPFGMKGEHAHDYFYDKNEKITKRTTRELTEEERKENIDIL